MSRRAPLPVEALEERVVNAALALGDSLDSVSMPDLARAAGLAVGTLYRVAPSKQDLAALVLAAAARRLDAAVLAAFPARLSVEERFRLIVARMCAFAEAEPRTMRHLAARGLPPGCGLVRAGAAFARDGAALGVTRPLDGPVLTALVWAPVAHLAALGGNPGAAAALLPDMLWAAVRTTG